MSKIVILMFLDILLFGANLNIYDFKAKKIDGTEISLEQYRDKVMLIVNVASKCGFTNQYAGLQKLYEKYNPKGLRILGFPCNQFLSQEPENEASIEKFCKLTYGVSFDMFQKIEVNGISTHPIYKYLKSNSKGIFGSESIKWNFTKFLIDKNGKIVKRFAPSDSPEQIENEIKKLL